jgi:hypothetical protein
VTSSTSPASAVPERCGTRFRVVTAAATALAAVLVFHGMGRKSIWFDEGVTAGLISTDWGPLRPVLRDGETNMILYTVLLKLWSTGGDGAGWLRALSGVAVVATTPLLAVVGRRLLGEATGAVAGVLLAVNAFAVHYGQELRSYGLTLFLTTLTLYLLCRLLDSPGAGLSVLWGIACSAVVYTHIAAAVVVLCEVVAFVALRRAGAAAALWPGIAVQTAVCAPLLWLMHREGSGRLSWVPPLRPSRVAPTVAEMVGAVGDSPLLWLYGVCLAAGIIFGWRSGRWWLAVAVGVGSLLVAAVVSIFVAPLFFARYMISSLPGMILLAAYGIAALPRGAVRGTLLAVVVVFASASVRAYHRALGTEDFRAAADFVATRAADRDGIAFFNPASQAAFALYVHDRGPRYLVPRVEDGDSLYDAPTPGGTVAEVSAAESELCDYRRLWVVSSHDRLKQSALFGDTVSRRGFRLEHTETMPGVTVRLYVRAAPDRRCSSHAAPSSPL